ncbi:cytochrome d ubiquinol oxidase subunit II, partial [Bacillus sp. RHFS18]|nr:cytochrome d ubiquinol oxidase subunit II [Bacillus sp. RHFS18]
RVIGVIFLVVLAFFAMSAYDTDMFTRRANITIPVFVLIVICNVLAVVFMSKKKDGWAFGMTGAGLALTVAMIFISLFPRVMVSSLKSAYDLTVANASSGDYSLKVMTIVALTLLPFVIGSQIWSYYVFRKRVSHKEPMTY